jgi:hypothetical protein
MTEDEIYQIFLDMMEERKVAGLLPWEPSRMDFAMKVADIVYDRGVQYTKHLYNTHNDY